MTKVAAAGHLPSSNDLHLGGVAGGCGGSKLPTMNLKRKTPSELRSELLKRKNPAVLVDESPVPDTSSMRNVDGAVIGSKKFDSSKAPRSTRIDEHYPVTKISRLLARKDNPKETVYSKYGTSLKNSTPPFNLNAKSQMQNSCRDDIASSKGGKEYPVGSSNATESCRNNAFVIPGCPSFGGETLNGKLDMDKGLIGLLLSCEPDTASDPLAKPTNKTGSIMPQSFSSELVVPGNKIPLDLTLKSSMRVLSSSSVGWFHRLINCGTSNYIALSRHIDRPNPNEACSSQPTTISKVTDPWTFHSWVHPQYALPAAAISALTSVAGGQMDFLCKRQQAWEDSFRSLYYMLRKKLCKVFYVCSSQFVVMFTAPDVSKETKCSCYAYISQSTRHLRSLLKEHDVSFSMPLCQSKVEEVTAEDLVELSEIEKTNLGQTRAIEALVGVDNSPQSLLMFTGSKNVHALYDFLLNYRYFLNSLTGDDVPVLHSPVPFENAALSAPEVRCKEVRRIDHIKESHLESEPNGVSSGGICYSIEITDAYLPPWVISGICNSLCAAGGDFQASFVTKSMTKGLNVGLDVAKNQPTRQVTSDEPTKGSDHSFGIHNATFSLNLQSAYLNELKYREGSYTASLSPVALD